MLKSLTFKSNILLRQLSVNFSVGDGGGKGGVSVDSYSSSSRGSNISLS